MNRITRLVAEREIREMLRTKLYWIIIGVLLLASLAGAILPEVLGGGGPDTVEIDTIGAPPAAVTDGILAAGEAIDVEFEFAEAIDEATLRTEVAEGDQPIGLIWGDEPTILRRSGDSEVEVALMQEVIRTVAANDALAAAGVDAGTIAEARNVTPASVEKLDADRGGKIAAASIVTIVMYIAILMLSQGVASSVAVEKANRVSEVLLAVGRPRHLLNGKVIAITMLGVATLVVGALPMVIKSLFGGSGLPEGFGSIMASAGLWFLGGALLYVLIAACIGAMVDRVEEVGSAMAPLTILLVVPYILSFALAEKPIGAVFGLFPLTSPIFMPARIAYDAAPWWEIVLSLVILALSVVLIARLAATVYGRAIVRTGKRLKLRDLRNV